ncbi:phage tail assembly chaperone [Alsobacter sp. KACC 23698]|uniref:Phage tail assembly chaperone n=1 Tax=Alsobacter sp. KACC 23698 TaxID=3149229 RepID=A0AAU7JN24_9HYPH
MAEKKIANRTYRYDRMPADQGLRMLLRLLKVLGPARGIIEAIAESDEAERDAKAMSAIGDFIGEMDSDAVYSIVMDMVKQVRVDGELAVPGVMDLQELLQVAMFALQTEFGSFFADGAGSALLKGRAA